MASINNFNPFGGNWFSKPPNPLPPPLNTLSTLSSPFPSPSNFASLSNSFKPKPKPKPDPIDDEPGPLTEMVEQFFAESETLPNHRNTPQVDEILNENPLFEDNQNLTEEEIKKNEKRMEMLREGEMFRFLLRAQEIADELNAIELKKNEKPHHSEDAELWKKVPNVIGLDGRPMPRKAIRSKYQADVKFWDFARQFFFGLWGYRQKHYPPCKPNDAAQALGYKNLEKRYYDFIMRSGGWFYKDRLGRTRGPLELVTLRTAWGSGTIDRNTFIWGEDMDEWAPIHMIYGMERAIATWDVRLAATTTAFFHKLQKGIPPWVPLKGFEKKTYMQLQEEAIESKRRDLAVLKANDGLWPGVRIPSHSLFLWASGVELTNIMEADHMPNKYIPKDLRQRLANLIPGLRPWEVLSIEQAMDRITFNGQWFREPLGSYTTGPPYVKRWNFDLMKFYDLYNTLNTLLCERLTKRFPGFDKIMDYVWQDFSNRIDRLSLERSRKPRYRAANQIDGLLEDKRPKGKP